MRQNVERLGVLPYLLLGVGMFALGLLAANQIVNNFWPFDVSRLDLVRSTALGRVDATAIFAAANQEILLAFLASSAVAATGLVLPLAYLINRRVVKQPTPPSLLIVLRQAMWVGLWFAFCVWLQMNRSLGIAIAGLVAAVLIMFEILLQVRARAATVAI